MERRWKHPLFKPSKRRSRETFLFANRGGMAGGGSFMPTTGSAIPASVVNSFGNFRYTERVGSVSSNRLWLFLTACSIAVMLSVVAIFIKAKFTYSPRVADLELANFSLKLNTPIDKEAFLARLSADSRRSVASQIHYVRQLIGGSKLSEVEGKKLATMIVLESMRSGYDPLFVAAVIKSESTFNRHAVSYAGAMGLMQIMPDTGKFVSKLNKVEWKGSHRLRDPEYNIRLGIAYLKHLESAFDGNRELMLIAYNWGPQNVVEALRNEKRIPFSCVRYARTILNNTGKWNTYFSKNSAQFKYMDPEMVS